MQILDTAIQPFFATWKTSLMCFSFDKFATMSTDDRLCAMMKTIVIEDDSEILDPWASSELPSATFSYDIWPRTESGNIISSEIQTAEFTTMLRERTLRPENIIIRDYHIAESNLTFCPEMTNARDRLENIIPSSKMPRHGAIVAFATNIMDGADLAITSLTIRRSDGPTTENSAIHSPRFMQSDTTTSLASPMVTEAILGLSIERQGQGVGFSLLRSAALWLGSSDAAIYWLEQLFYHAPALQSLKLSITDPQRTPLDLARVTCRLTDFELSHTAISAEALIAMLASSTATLTCLRLRQVTLEEGSTWRELLSFIASRYPALSFFSLRILREFGASMAIDFRALLEKDSVPKKYRLGLDLVPMGPEENRRVTKLSYSGPDASGLLDIISRCGREGIPNYGTVNIQ